MLKPQYLKGNISNVKVLLNMKELLVQVKIEFLQKATFP